METSLLGKTAIVCGSSQGIGKAAAIELALLGAKIVLMARNRESLQVVRDDLPYVHGVEHQCLVADFSDVMQVSQVLQAHLQAPNAVQILVNNTGGPPGGTALNASLAEYQQAFQNHLLCNQILVQHCVPSMQQTGYGRIINIISTSVKQPIPGLGVSNTIRGAVASWAKTLAYELGPYGITVNNVLPGFTDTARLTSLIQSRAAAEQTDVDTIRRGMQSSIPTGRFADPREIGAAVAFLATPAAAYINGINLPVDGGRTSCL